MKVCRKSRPSRSDRFILAERAQPRESYLISHHISVGQLFSALKKNISAAWILLNFMNFMQKKIWNTFDSWDTGGSILGLFNDVFLTCPFLHDEVETVWNEAIVTYFKAIYLERLRKTNKNFSKIGGIRAEVW